MLIQYLGVIQQVKTLHCVRSLVVLFSSPFSSGEPEIFFARAILVSSASVDPLGFLYFSHLTVVGHTFPSHVCIWFVVVLTFRILCEGLIYFCRFGMVYGVLCLPLDV